MTSSLSKLLSEYRSLPHVAQRTVAAIVGSAVGDAATRPVHWVYDRSVIESIIGDTNPEFWTTSLSPFYTMETGMRSCYSDEGLAMLKSLSSNSGEFSKDATYLTLETMFNAESDYAKSFLLRKKAYSPSQREKKRDPIPGPWQQSGITNFLAARAEGKDPTGDAEHKETDGFCLAIPLVARLSAQGVSDEVFRSSISTAIKILSGSETSLSHGMIAASILRVIITADPESATCADLPALAEKVVMEAASRGEGGTEVVKTEYLAVKESLPASSSWGETGKLSAAYLDAAATFGKACPYPGNFQTSLLAILTCNSFVEAIRRNIVAGGCNCSRANWIGACFGALYGINVDEVEGGGKEEEGTTAAAGIPVSWIANTDKGEEILAMAIELCS